MNDCVYQLFIQQKNDRGIDLEKGKQKIKSLKVEIPLRGYSDSRTRFKVFKQAGLSRNQFGNWIDGSVVQVSVDTGHHPQGTNVEHIVAYLLDEKKLGGFHFNSRKYADDDLIVGAINPYELFLIFYQILDAAEDSDPEVRQTAENIAYMIDQSHNIEPKIPAMIRSVLNVQTQYAKALLINLDEVRAAQEKQDVLAAENAVREAFEMDVSPLLAAVREEMGVPIDPMKAYYESGYAEKIASRGKGGASW